MTIFKKKIGKNKKERKSRYRKRKYEYVIWKKNNWRRSKNSRGPDDQVRTKDLDLNEAK